jgi:hypothetical protein
MARVEIAEQRIDLSMPVSPEAAALTNRDVADPMPADMVACLPTVSGSLLDAACKEEDHEYTQLFSFNSPGRADQHL